MASFAALPAEIQKQIIDLAVDIGPKQAGNCAAVSRTWQAHVERKAFATLRFTLGRSKAADKIVTPARRRHVRHVQLDALLWNRERDNAWLQSTEERYEGNAALRESHARLWADREKPEEIRSNNGMFSMAVDSLCSFLAGWDLSLQGEGITLEVRAFQPNDKRMHPVFGWTRSRRWEHSHVSLDLERHRDMPDVGIITTFRVPCDPATERRITAASCCDMAALMPNLTTAEWDLSDNEEDEVRRTRMRDDFASALGRLPHSLRHFNLKYGRTRSDSYDMRPYTCLFQQGCNLRSAYSDVEHEDPDPADLAELYVDFGAYWGAGAFLPVNDEERLAEAEEMVNKGRFDWPDPMSTALYNLSQQLVTMTVEGGVVFDTNLFWPDPSRSTPKRADAVGFLSPEPKPSPHWPRLEVLKIQASIITPSGGRFFKEDADNGSMSPNQALLDQLCISAARAAAKMPNLRCLEVRWETQRDVKELRYNIQRRDSFTSLELPSGGMSYEVLDAWRSASEAHLGPVVQEERRETKSPGTSVSTTQINFWH